MKKAVFTIQMFVLMAAFPAYLVVELNQSTGSMPVNNRPTEFIEKPGGNNIQPVLNPENKELSYYSKSVKASALVSKADVK